MPPAARVRRATRGPAPRRETRGGWCDPAPTPDWLIGAILLSAVSAVMLLLCPPLRHWFILPVTAAGVLIVPDTVRWARRRTDLFDPQAMLSLVGLHLFYVAPVLHVVWQFWPRFLLPATDWPAALGHLAILNCVGLCLYRFAVTVPVRPRPAPARTDAPARTGLREEVLYPTGLAAIMTSVLAFGTLVMIVGGPAQLLVAYTRDREALEHLGWLLIVAEAFPLIGFALILVRWRDHLAARASLLVVLVAGFAAVQFLVAGLRGSRSNTLWPIALGVIMVHLLVRRISWRAFALTALGCGVFLYSYGLYKGAGTDVLRVLDGRDSVAGISEQTGRDLPTLLLGDLSRADVQALVLDRHRQGAGDLGYGASYLNAAVMLVPTTVLPHRPPGKVELGTDLTKGNGMYEAGHKSSRIYGLAGEAILNFGPAGAVLSFLLLGGLARWARHRYLAAQRGGVVARLLAPALSVATPVVLLNDAGNYVWFTVKYLLPLAAVVAVAVLVTGLRHATPADVADAGGGGRVGA